jgi:hypothetical protein
VWGACAWIGSGWCSGDGPWVRGEGGLVLSNAGQGINRKLPHLGNAGQGINRKGGAAFADDASPAGSHAEWLAMLSDRLRSVRVACGEWDRVTGDSVLDPMRCGGPVGVFLDPPYDAGNVEYSAGGTGVAADVRDYAIRIGARPECRVALCGYNEHDALEAEGWTPHRWKTKGGYSSQGGENANQSREVVWFSPHCVGAAQPGLFDAQPIQPGRPAKDGAA